MSQRNAHRRGINRGEEHRLRKPLEPEEEGKATVSKRDPPSAVRIYHQLPSASGKRNGIFSSMRQHPQSHRKCVQRKVMACSMPPVRVVKLDFLSRCSSNSGSDSSCNDGSSSDSSSGSSSNSNSSNSHSTRKLDVKEGHNTSKVSPKTRSKVHPKSYCSKLSSATALSTDISPTFERKRDVRRHACQPLEKTPSYKALLAMMKIRRQSFECNSPVHSESWNESGSSSTEGGSRYSKLPVENESEISEDGSSSRDDVSNVKSESATEIKTQSTTSSAHSELPPLSFSVDAELTQKQIQYLHHNAPGWTNNGDEKKQPEMEYITDQLKKIKERREIIHKRVGDEAVISQENSFDIYRSSSYSIFTEESRDHSGSSLFPDIDMIQYLHHNQKGTNGTNDKKQPEMEYITHQLKQIKKVRELIHKRVEDEAVFSREISSDIKKCSSHSMFTEESLGHSCCLDMSRVEHNSINNYSSILLADMEKSLHLSDLDLQNNNDER